jgi:DNA polymerase I-like protein with 3'-5' exonuclease and polymerase domains
MLEVLPDIETTPIVDIEEKTSKYAHYQIEGQINGRLLSSNKFQKSYIPHRLGPLDKENLRPFGYGKLFIYADFKNCEVTVLQHLSQDDHLKELIDSKEDFYSQIYKIVTGQDCEDKQTRNNAKILFLPVMYGCGYKRLASNLKISEDTANLYISKIHEEFPVAISYMQKQQETAKSKKEVCDYFGRIRKFEEPYKARNFVIQSVAAAVCLEKIVSLYREIKISNLDLEIAFTVHDGFGFYTNPANSKESFNLIKSVLESESVLCKGLKLNTKIEFGKNLNKMDVLWN